MSGIFNLESPVVRAVTRVGDLAVLSILWFLGCVPIVTIGTSNTAMYAAIHKVFAQKEGIAAVEFLKSFKSNFRQATLSFLPLGLLELLLLAECFVTGFLQEQGAAWGNLRPVFLVLSYLVGLWMVYVAAYAARFQDSAKTTICQSAILALANPLQSILLLFALSACGFVLPVFPPLILFLPGLYGWIAHRVMEKIFSAYLN